MSMSAIIPQTVRDNALYAYGYLNGRSFSIPHSLSALYGTAVAKGTSLIALPLPLLSFLILPFFGGTATTVNLAFFYLTWTALVWSYDPMTVELGGTLAIRLIFYLLPALGFLGLDLTSPRLIKSIKARGEINSPAKLSRNKLIEIGAVATANVLLAVALQAGLELLNTNVFHLRSIIKVTSTVPFPWTIAKDAAKGFVVRGILRYAIHRYVLHTYDSPLKSWHSSWQHSVQYPFSIVAAYDHPINYLIGQWLPTFAPAYLFRYHVLTWHITLVLVSLEDLFVYSGYVGLPSRIMLTGMARRVDAHFLAAQTSKPNGNFGHLGLLDLICGTTCPDEADLMEDLQDEAKKHNVRERAENAASGAWEGLKDDDGDEDYEPSGDDNEEGKRATKKKAGKTSSSQVKGEDVDHAKSGQDDGEDDEDDGPPQEAPRRRGGRRKGRKE